MATHYVKPMTTACNTSHGTAVKGFTASFSEIAVKSTSKSGDTVNYYAFEGIISSPGDHYRLCFCAGLGGYSCVQTADFAYDFGELVIVGPADFTSDEYFECVKGYTCEFGQLSGVRLHPGDEYRIQAECNSDEATEVSEGNDEGEAFVTGSERIGDSFLLTLSTGSETLHCTPKKYAICWCSNAKHHSGECKDAADLQDFNVQAGWLYVEGPNGGHDLTCYMGQNCILKSITGVKMVEGDTTDRLSIFMKCGSGEYIDALPGIGYAASEDAKKLLLSEQQQ
jgi:hypothetical protein